MFKINKSTKNTSIIMMLIGVVATIFGFISNPNAAWASLLFNNYFFFGIAVFAIFFISLQYVAEAGWSTVVKRVPEAMMSFLPYGGIIMLCILITAALHFGGNHVYHWMAEGIMDPNDDHYDKIIAGKEAYLNTPFFLIRSIVTIAVWIYFAKKLKDLSLEGDLEGGLGDKAFNKGVRVSAFFIIFFAITINTVAWDWIMSIDTHWFSTLFGWYIFSEWAAIGFTTIVLLTLYLKSQGHLESVNDSHIHDLGKFVFAFSLVWSYLWFSQFMLIWYSNIPEEVTYFMERIDDYGFLFWGSLVINLVLPLVLLMSRDAKRDNKRLVFVCIMILIGHWINAFLLVIPGSEDGNIGLTEIGMGIGFLGLFLYVVLRSLTKRPLDIKHHPYLDESKHLNT